MHTYTCPRTYTHVVEQTEWTNIGLMLFTVEQQLQGESIGKPCSETSLTLPAGNHLEDWSRFQVFNASWRCLTKHLKQSPTSGKSGCFSFS